jgi:hypothetical protein
MAIPYKSVLLSLATLILLTLPLVANAAKHGDKATGHVIGSPEAHPFWWHSFDFSAHELATPPFGKGSMIHVRLNSDATEIIREEILDVVYAIVEGDEAWFAGPIIYDSANVLPLRWIVLHVVDGGRPGTGNDSLWWTRVATETEARSMVEAGTTPAGDIVVAGGNLTIHTR